MNRTLIRRIHCVLAVAFIVTIIISCGRSRTAEDRDDAAQDDTYEDAATVDTVEDADEGIDEEDAEVAYRDSGLAPSTDSDSGVPQPTETDSGRPSPPDNDASEPPPQPRPAVTPDELTDQVLDTYHDEANKPDKPAQTEPQDCGYTMRIEYEQYSESSTTGSEGESLTEFRYFDQEGRLLLQQSDTLRTEVSYDQQGRPITVWVDLTNGMGPLSTTESCIIAIGYKSDGSAEVKLMSEELLGSRDCDYVLFDEQLRMIRRARDNECDGAAEEVVDISYDPQTGQPISYKMTSQYNPEHSPKTEEEISWSYTDDGKQVKAVFTDLYPPTLTVSVQPTEESSIVFTYDDEGALILVEADYENDGVVDEYSDYLYDEQGKLLRQGTYIDDDDIIDLLRANTYTHDGRLLTQTLRNLTPPGMGLYFYDSDFDDMDPATARTITYTYDNDNRLIHRETENTHDTKTEQYTYDALDRPVEHKISVDNFNWDDGSLLRTTEVTCTYEFQCDQTTLAESDLHLCQLGTPLHYFIFPYRDVPKGTYPVDRETAFFLHMIPYSDVRMTVGIPWY